ncbi:MAG: hypothetical protein LBG79_03675, partial [Spirochaetaceae bacterium]|nr:hypothetical protein [Spirochaetaceae bacterium]
DGTVLRANYTRADTNWHKFDSQANPSTAAAAFDFSTAISGNTTFVAKWNPNSYTLNFSTNGDATDPVTPSTVTGVTYTYPATVTSIPSVTRPHYVFSSWKNGSDTLAVGQLVTASKTYTAQWTGATYTVTFRSNGGIFSDAGDSQTRAFSGQYPAFKPTVPTPSNDAFDIVCYNTKSDNSGQILENGRTSGQMTNPVGASVDYYAIWSLKDNQVYEPSSDEPWKGETVTIAIIAEANYRIELWGAAGGPAGSGNPSNYTWNSGQYVLADGRTIKSAGDPLLNGKPSPSTTGDASGYMSGGGGAYVAGTVHLNTGDTLVINIGGARIEKTDTSSGGGFNGGGSGYGTGAGAGDGAGGGATDVRINGNELKHRIIVAAGGGGSSDGRLGGSNYTAVLWKGGYAGIFGNKFDYEAYTTFRGAVNLLGITGWESAIGDDPGWGALRDKGGMCPINTGQAGKWGYGGNAAGAAESYGAGGGGWFGGSSGGQQNANGAGGGGSSYVSGIAGFIACAETSTDATIPATGKQTNRIGGFVPRYQPTDSATDTQRATSWTGYTFTNVTMIDGGGYKCVWDSSSGDAIRTLQAMPKPSGGYYPLGYGHEGPGSVKINKVP